MFDIYKINKKDLNNYLNFEFYSKKEIESETDINSEYFIDFLTEKELYNPYDNKTLWKEDLDLTNEKVFKKINYKPFKDNVLLSYFKNYLINNYLSLLEEPFIHSKTLDFQLEVIKRINLLIIVNNIDLKKEV
jgi:hypothetical protein